MSLTEKELSVKSEGFQKAYAIVNSNDRSANALKTIEDIQSNASGDDAIMIAQLVEAFLVSGGIENELESLANG